MTTVSKPARESREKVDLRKTLDSYRGKVGEFRDIEMPTMRYLMVDGNGDPNTSSDFADAIQALYPVGYTLKFASKSHLDRDYVVPPLEGLWWASDYAAFTHARDKSKWQWTLMLLIPDWVPDDLVAQALLDAQSKRPNVPRINDVRAETLREGRCIQTLHVGPFDDEAAVLHKLHTEIAPRLGVSLAGTHHEIYLSDRRRVPPSAQRTLLRQPVSG